MSEQSQQITTEDSYLISPLLFSDKVVRLVQENKADDHLLDTITVAGNHINLNKKKLTFDRVTGEIITDIENLSENHRVVAYHEEDNYAIVAPVDKTTDEEVAFI